jgi:DNA polymerase III subunit alpha
MADPKITAALAGPVLLPRFVHLKVHSAYSLLEGALPIGKLAKLAEGDSQAALAITDTDNLFGALEFSDKLAGMGIQPIVGCTLAIDFGDGAKDEPRQKALKAESKTVLAGRIALLAMSEAGYANLMTLTSAAFLDTAESDQPHVKWSLIERHVEGLIALTGGPDGPIDKALADGQVEPARARLSRLAQAFGDRLYVELQRHGMPAERAVEPQLLDLAYALGLPVVATNEIYFGKAADYEAHDTLICIAEGRYVSEDDRRKLTPEHCFKSQDAMCALFSDLPEAAANTLEIARRCHVRSQSRNPILPQFVAAPPGADASAQLAAEAAELRRQAEDGLRARLAKVGLAPGKEEKEYWDRLAFELEIIAKMKFPGYFLIVADFIQWAKAHDIPVGPGRGSGAGSLVAYSLTITDLDPLRFGLLFERFLNPERVSMPDFDIDFCQERRDEVIDYVQKKYGVDRVAQIITFGRLQARAVLRDVGRVQQMSYGQVDKLCKLVPNNPANPVTLAQAIDGEPKLQEARDNDPQVAGLLDIALKLEGLYRNASTHAAGIVIADRPLTELVPLYRDPRSSLPATQFNMKYVEAAGLVKFDFLGLKTLTVIQKALQLLKRRGIDLDLATLGIDDAKTYELLSRADAAGVFQLESTGMREALKRLKPDRFEDIIAMVSLYRPGPMDNIPTYIARKHGKEQPDYMHPALEPVLKETYGVIIYQEQVQQIAQVLAGYSLGEADLLRRAMGKKIKAEMEAQKSRFLDGAAKNGVKKADADTIFELVNKFAGYGFNKSHAAAYALVAYQTAYLKANYPTEFFAATMTLDRGNTDKLGMFVSEARRSGLEVLKPSINASIVDFVPENSAIRYSMAALKNVGEQAVAHVVAERARNGPFKSLTDFAARFDPKMLNKRALEMLAASGCFDDLEKDRAKVYASVEFMLSEAQRLQADKASGQNDMFGSGATKTGGAVIALRGGAPKSWLPMERLQKEFDGVGFFLSGHPLDQYQKVLDRLGVLRWTQFEAKCQQGAASGMLAGMLVSLRERRSAKGNRFAFAAFSDPSGQFEAVLFSDALVAAEEVLQSGKPLLLRVEAERDGETIKVRTQSVESLERAAAGVTKGIKIIVDKAAAFLPLRDVLSAKGRGEVRFAVRIGASLGEGPREMEVRLPGRFDISPDRTAALHALPGVLEVQEL